VVSWLLRTTAAALPETQRLRLCGALHELLLNAVEHGTLELGFLTKQQALAEGRYEAVLRRRATESRFKDRQITVQVSYEKEIQRLSYRIIDEGKGFMWRRFLTQSPDAGHTAAVSGRGIFLARAYFPGLTYNDRGNEVTITVPLA
jgi:anti-sigma regulatory factor (Ser/Thr protein kinase)